MTVAPQNLIWPQGRTYPRKAVSMTARRRMVPTFQVSCREKEP